MYNLKGDVLMSNNTALSKRKYLQEMAPESVKKFSKFGLIFMFVTLIFIVSCYMNFANKSIYEIPLISIDDGNVKSDSIENECDLLNDVIDEALDQGDLSKKEERALKKLQKSTEKLSKKVSLNTVKNFVKTLEDIEDVIEDNTSADFSLIEDAHLAIKIVSTFVLCLFILLCVPFTLLGGLFRINVLVILGMLFTTILAAIFCGWLFVILSIALHIVIIVCNGKVKSAYKNYKASLA